MSLGRVLLTLVGLATSIGCYLADWNDTHIYNDAWPPHAKFHNAQTMSMGLTLGILTLYYTWRPTFSKPNSGADHSYTRTYAYAHDSLYTACLLGSLYWITQITSIMYPGTSFADPPYHPPSSEPQASPTGHFGPPFRSYPPSPFLSPFSEYLSARINDISAEMKRDGGIPAPQSLLFVTFQVMVLVAWRSESRRLRRLYNAKGTPDGDEHVKWKGEKKRA